MAARKEERRRKFYQSPRYRNPTRSRNHLNFTLYEESQMNKKLYPALVLLIVLAVVGLVMAAGVRDDVLSVHGGLVMIAALAGIFGVIISSISCAFIRRPGTRRPSPMARSTKPTAGGHLMVDGSPMCPTSLADRTSTFTLIKENASACLSPAALTRGGHAMAARCCSFAAQPSCGRI